MKTKILRITLLTVVVLGVAANKSVAQTAAGLKGGMTWSSMNGSHAFENNINQSTTYGGFAKFSFGVVFSIQPEILFTEKGGSNYDMLRKTHEYYNLRYVEFPLLFKIGVQSGMIYPNVFLGPYYAALQSANYTVKEDTQFPTMNIRDDDLGIVGGVGFDLSFRKLFFTIDSRYALGVRSLDEGGSYDKREIRNGSLMVSAGLGYRFVRHVPIIDKGPSPKF